MSADPPNFDPAQYLQPVPASAAAGTTARANSTPPGLLLRSILFGLAGVVAGAVLYGGFIQLTHINIGYLAIVVAWLVARAMMAGSGERGGRSFQVAAIVLTCLSVALGNSLMAYWGLGKQQAVHLSAHNLLLLLRFGLLEPFYEFQDSAAGALLSLFILFIGLRAAWRMTSGIPGAIRHPFSRGF